MVKMQAIDPGWSWDEKLPLEQGLKVGNLLFLSGQVALDADGSIIGKSDLGAQTRQVFTNIGTLLAAAGADFHNVVKLTTFFTVDITDLDRLQPYFDVRREFFGTHKPTSTGVQITALIYPELMLEVEAVAVLG